MGLKTTEKVSKNAGDIELANRRIKFLEGQLQFAKDRVAALREKITSALRWIGITIFCLGTFTNEICQFFQLQYKLGFGYFQIGTIIFGFFLFIAGCRK